MTPVRRKWLRRILAAAIVLLVAALLGFFTPSRRDARLTFVLRPNGSRLRITLPPECTLKRLERLSGPAAVGGTLTVTAANGWSAALPLATASAAEWQQLERDLQNLPPGCTWTMARTGLPEEQAEQQLQLTLHGPSEALQEWISWVRLLPASEKTGEDSGIGD